MWIPQVIVRSARRIQRISQEPWNLSIWRKNRIIHSQNEKPYFCTHAHGTGIVRITQ